VQRFDKSLEEFYAICDQIELNLVSMIILITTDSNFNFLLI